MNSLKQPRGWVNSSVGELFEIKGGGTPPTENPAFWDGSIPWMTSADIHGLKDIKPRKKITLDAIEKSATHYVPKGSIIVVTRVGLGKLALAPTDLCFSQDCQALICDWNDLVPEYCLYYLSEAVQIFKYKNQGTTISGVTVKQLRELEFSLPPLPEQHRIVTKIEELFTQIDAGVASLKKVQAQLKRYRQAVLKAAFEGRLTQEWREVHQGEIEPAEVIIKRIKDTSQQSSIKCSEKSVLKILNKPTWLPEEWVWISITAVSLLITDGDHYPPKRVPKGVPHLTAKNVKNGHLLLDGCSYISEEDFQKVRRRYDPKEGDVIITCVGTLGQIAIIPPNFVFSPDRNLAAVRVIDKIILPEFLVFMMNSLYYQRIFKIASGSTAQPHFYLKDLRALEISIPSINEQKQIIEEIERHISQIEHLEHTITTSLRQAESLRQSILKRAFEGKLVPQDPTDEPASILLERIKAEKARHAAVTKKGKTLQPKSPKRKVTNDN